MKEGVYYNPEFNYIYLIEQVEKTFFYEAEGYKFPVDIPELDGGDSVYLGEL